MIAVDSNVLAYAHREDSDWHNSAYACLLELAEERAPWPCLHQFLGRVVRSSKALIEKGSFNVGCPVLAFRGLGRGIHVC